MHKNHLNSVFKCRFLSPTHGIWFSRRVRPGNLLYGQHSCDFDAEVVRSHLDITWFLYLNLAFEIG